LQRPLTTRITRQEIPIEKRMEEIVNELKGYRGKKKFTELFPYRDKNHIVVTFLALLELMKKNAVLIEQQNNFSEIYISSMERDYL